MTGSAQSAVGIVEQTAAAAGDGNQAVASAVQQMKTIEAVNAMEQGTKEVVMGGDRWWLLPVGLLKILLIWSEMIKCNPTL